MATEKREARELATGLQRVAARIERPVDDRGLSENPDRGFADHGPLRIA